MMSLTTACVSINDGCAWVEKITVQAEDVLVRSTKEQIVVHNMAVDKFCR